MPNPVLGIVAGSVASSAIGAKSAKNAAQAQVAASEAGVAETRAAREELRTLLQPYTQAGIPALQEQLALVGLAGPEKQQAALSAQEASPYFQALTRQGENAILQNASATGGLRGGNVQAALSQFRPNVLNSLIEQQYNRLGGLTALGQQSAAGVGTAGMQSSANIAQLLADAGAARAGSSIAQGNAWGGALGNLTGLLAGGAFGGGFGGGLPMAGITSAARGF